MYRLISCLLFFLLLAPALAGQKEQKEQTPVLRVTTRMVQVNVVVHDNKGQPVTSLTRDDFVLLEDGKEQPITQFSVEEDKPPSPSAEGLPAGMYTNRPSHRAGSLNSVTVILLDAVNTRLHDSFYAKEQVIKFLGQLQPEDRVALYAFVPGSVNVLHDFTRDASALLAALRRNSPKGRRDHPGEEPGGDGNTALDGLDEWSREAERRYTNFQTTSRVLETTSALEAIANHLSRLPGRKNLIWVSGSFPLSIGEDALPTRYSMSPERRTFWREVDRAARAVSNANVAIYPVDARGLIGAFGPNPGAFAATRVQPGRASPFPGAPLSTFDSMKVLAQRTGGRAFYNRNDIGGAIRRAIEDSRVTYVLGYYPTHGKWDGKFHQIKVKAKPKGLELRHRNGYFAHEDVSREESDRKDLLFSAARSPLDATTLGITVRLTELPQAAGPRIRLDLEVERREITFARESDKWVGTLDLFFSLRSPEGRGISGIHQTLNMRLSQENYDQITKYGINLNRELELPASATQLRIVVRDVPSGATGSLGVPLPGAGK